MGKRKSAIKKKKRAQKEKAILNGTANKKVGGTLNGIKANNNRTTGKNK
ncbi:hypothetical protein [Enterococcus sp.]